MNDVKKLVRPKQGRWVAGVCAGFAQYYGLDATLIRVVLALLICLAGTGLLAYLICWIVIPSEA